MKCHVLIDLKIDDLFVSKAATSRSAAAARLNYYREHGMTEGDNPTVGLILCADKDDSLVRYATGGMANELLVSKAAASRSADVAESDSAGSRGVR